MKQYLQDYLYYLRVERNLSPNTLASYKFDITRYLNYLASVGISHPDEVTYDVLSEYLEYLCKTKLSAKSRQRHIFGIRSFHNFLLDEGYSKASAASALDLPKVPFIIPSVLSNSETDLLLFQTDTRSPAELRDRAILETFFSTGMRVGELVELKFIDINAPENTVRIFGKGSKERLIPIGRTALYWIDQYLAWSRPRMDKKQSPYVFLNQRGEKFSRMAIWYIVNTYTRKAKITKNVHPHTLRHSYATALLSGGAGIMDIKELLGHSDISTTAIYAHVSPDTKQAVIATYHPRG